MAGADSLESEPVGIPVLLYHAVHDERPRGGKWTVPPEQFRIQMECIENSGRTSSVFSALTTDIKKQSIPPDRVVITFDDGYADTLWAASLLASRGLSCTVFVAAGLVGQPGMLTVEALRELASLPLVEIGAHSIDHPHLDELDAASLRRQMEGSRDLLQQMLGRAVTVFAYPHGAFDGRCLALAKEMGLDGCAAVKNALTHCRDNPFAVARWTVTQDQPMDRFRSIVHGSGAPLASEKELLSTRAYRTARRLRRRVRRA